jgi:hypothetical protein
VFFNRYPHFLEEIALLLFFVFLGERIWRTAKADPSQSMEVQLENLEGEALAVSLPAKDRHRDKAKGPAFWAGPEFNFTKRSARLQGKMVVIPVAGISPLYCLSYTRTR